MLATPAAARSQGGVVTPAPLYAGAGAAADRLVGSARSERGEVVALLDARGELTVWDAACGARLRARIPSGHHLPINQRHDGAPLALGQGGRFLASAGNDGRLRVWEARDGRLLFIGEQSVKGTTLTRPSDGPTNVGTDFPLTDVRFTPDGWRLVTASSLGSVAVWQLPGGHRERLLWPSVRPEHLDVSPDGATLVVAGGDVELLSITGEARVRLGDSTLAAAGGAYDARFSPGGGVLAVATGKGEVRLYALATQERLHTLRMTGDALFPRFLTFSPDGRRVMAVSGANTAHVWDVATGALVEAHSVAWVPQTAWLTADGRRLAFATYRDRRLRTRPLEVAMPPEGRADPATGTLRNWLPPCPAARAAPRRRSTPGTR